ncbi:hypothetical protein ACFXG4_08415 [Nocardia sp. NPDC059246]|uniref:hypothetical protein n=1 Tax=unclassified Nocardia TaxID=2637762 RepID=UPI0036B5DD6D
MSCEDSDPAPDVPESAALAYVREWAAAIAAAAGPGCTVERVSQPPYGWKLTDPHGRIRDSGSLDQLARCLRVPKPEV